MRLRSTVTVAAAVVLLAPSIPFADDPAPLTVTLSTGSTLTLPAPAQILRMPNARATDRAFRLNPLTILVISEIGLDGRTCEQRLAVEWAQLKKNQANVDPVFKALKRINKVERQAFGATAAIYSEVDTRAPKEARAGKPYHGGAGYLLCQRDTYLNVALSVAGDTLDPDTRDQLGAIVKSYRPKASPAR